MRKSICLSAVAALVIIATGCTGPAHKLGRGLNNLTEIARMGELRRSMEQAALWESPEAAYTTGVIVGLNRTVVRTVVGAAEVVTFPIPTPSYDAFYEKDDKTSYQKGDVYVGGPFRKDQVWSWDFMTGSMKYPANFRPGLLSDSLFATDTALGFSAGDVMPFVPGSRFHIFDY